MTKWTPFVLAIGLILALYVAWSEGPATASPSPLPGRLVTIEAFASKSVAPRKVIVWLPPSYDQDVANGSAAYDVLYMHDARNLFEPATAMGGETWGVAEAANALMAQGKIRKTIIVGMDNTKARSREYMPNGVYQALSPDDQATLAKAMGGPPLSDGYLKFIVEELKPFIDRTYKTQPGRDHTFIMGSSMGGLISLYALAEYPNVFGGAGCLSTHWPLPAFDLLMRTPQIEQEHSVSAFKQYLGPRLKTLKNHKLWLDHGTETLDRLYGPYQEQIDAFLSSMPADKAPVWTSRVYPGAAHNEASWRAHIDDPLVFLLGTEPGNSKRSK